MNHEITANWKLDNSVALPAGAVYRTICNHWASPSFDVRHFAGSYVEHKKMMAGSGSDAIDPKLLYYMACPRRSVIPTPNSTDSSKLLSFEYYRKIERQLAGLSDDPDNDGVERGAIDSALEIVRQLEGNDLAPPALSWHGGDAVVMLWALGDTTYAITVTDGELGYVVRRNRKALRSAHSIQISEFKLVDLR